MIVVPYKLPQSLAVRVSQSHNNPRPDNKSVRNFPLLFCVEFLREFRRRGVSILCITTNHRDPSVDQPFDGPVK